MGAEDNIKRITDLLRLGHYANNPHGAAEDRAILSGEYGWICGQLEIIFSRKPAIWNEMRKDVKSDTACERVYQKTTDGINEQGLRLRAKAIEKMMTGLGTLIKLAEHEALNQM